MGFDNRIFNINGKTLEDLKLVTKLAFSIDGPNTKAKAWRFIPNKGLVFLWIDSQSKSNKFPVPLDSDEVASMAFKWLKSDDAKTVPCLDEDSDYDHDGSNSEGWRAYLENWGHVGDEHYAILCIKPAFLWHGK